LTIVFKKGFDMKLGDVVALKSGSEKLTVVGIEDSIVEVYYFYDGLICSGRVPQICLDVISTTPSSNKSITSMEMIPGKKYRCTSAPDSQSKKWIGVVVEACHTTCGNSRYATYISGFKDDYHDGWDYPRGHSLCFIETFLFEEVV
jgi:hypothetical protein